MGCFSFICQETDRGVESTSWSGEPVYLFLLRQGEVVEMMYGNYDSYGRVFTTERVDGPDSNFKSFEWEMSWSDVCSLMHNHDHTSGIAAVLVSHYTGTFPTVASEDDPNQGWGDEGELLGNTDADRYAWVEDPYHKVFK
jgi:hypothetical protein